MRIILADHHEQPCWALRTMIEEQPEFNLLGDTRDANSLLALAETSTPDLVIVDSELPGAYIEDLISQLHKLEPRPTVIVMSSTFEDSRKLLKAGADAFLSKGDEPEWFLSILKKFESEVKMGYGR